MPKLYITGIPNPIIISKKESEAIINAEVSKITSVNLDCGLIKISSIKAITNDIDKVFSNNQTFEYDVDNPTHYNIIRDFEFMLNNYSSNNQQPINFYGTPFNSFSHLSNNSVLLAKYSDYVRNPLLGGWNWRYIAYAVDQRIINKVNDGLWTILSQDGKIKRFNEFTSLLFGLKQLIERRGYQQAKSDSAVILSDSKDIQLENLPF